MDWLEFDQLIFHKLFKTFNRKKVDPNAPFAVELKEISGRLTLIARALSAKPIRIIASEREGGWQGLNYFLPKSIALFSSIELNMKLYLFRLFYLHIQQNLGLNWPANHQATTQDAQLAAQKHSKTILAVLFKEYPAMQTLFSTLKNALPVTQEKNHSFTDTSWLFGRFMRHVQYNENGDTLQNFSEKPQAAHNEKPSTVLEAKHADEIESIAVDKKKQEDFMLTNNFEKVDTLEEFNGVWRDFDGDDTLEEDEEALQELNLKHMVRVDDPTHSVYQADFINNATVAESKTTEHNGFHLLYPEWDFKSRSYKENFCKIFPKKVDEKDNHYLKNTLTQNRGLLTQLKKTFALLNNQREQVTRQINGDDIDIDAATDLFVDLKARRNPNERVYISKRKKAKELSLLFLLDLSLSSDAYANGNRIIDVEKQISILFGEVLNEYGIDFQIDGFYSKTRNNTSYITLKAFNDSWQQARDRIGTVEPTGYTRIGPAIRHATSILEKNPHRKKWLILLSDGKPNDYDKYEGKYGVEDIKQSLREMRVNGIENFAFAIEEQAKYYLPQMFGDNRYNILTSPAELLHALTKLYARIEQG